MEGFLCMKYFQIQIILDKLNKSAEILGTRVGKSWTHHLCLGVTIFTKITKNALVGLVTFCVGLVKILSCKCL